MVERTRLIDGKLHRLVCIDRNWLDKLLGRQRTAWKPVEPEFKG